VIRDSRLGRAKAGTAYSHRLTTTDNDSGAWLLRSGTLPPGLSLNANGTLAGTPAASGVGDHQFQVHFTDPNQRSADATIRVYVDPATGIGGGDIQVTPTWQGTEDLDLHVEEPNGNEVYYSNPGPSATYGELDHDANAACGSVDPAPAENIRWPASTADAGTYWVRVVTYDTCSDTNLSWRLVARLRGQVVLDRTGSSDSGYIGISYPTGTLARTAAPAPRTTYPRKG